MNQTNPAVCFFWFGLAESWRLHTVDGFLKSHNNIHNVIFIMQQHNSIMLKEVVWGWGTCTKMHSKNISGRTFMQNFSITLAGNILRMGNYVCCAGLWRKWKLLEAIKMPFGM